MLEVGVNGGAERHWTKCTLFPGTSCIFQRATEQHFGEASLLKSGIIVGHDRYISGSFGPGSIKHTAVVKECRCAEPWEETSLSSLGGNFWAKGFWSAALGVWKVLVEMLELWYAPVLFAFWSVSKPLQSQIAQYSVLPPLNTSVSWTVLRMLWGRRGYSEGA